MDSKEAITKIKVLLGLETDAVELQFAQATLVDGTTVRVEGELEAGKPLFVVGEEGEIPAPAGQHETTTGMLVTVDDNGMITEVTAIEVEAEEEEKTEEVQMEEEKEEVVVEMTEDDKKKVEMADALVETLLPYLEQIDEMKEKVAEVEAQMAKMSAEPAAKRIKRNENHQDERSSRVDRLVTLKKTK